MFSSLCTGSKLEFTDEAFWDTQSKQDKLVIVAAKLRGFQGSSCLKEIKLFNFSISHINIVYILEAFLLKESILNPALFTSLFRPPLANFSLRWHITATCSSVK